MTLLSLFFLIGSVITFSCCSRLMIIDCDPGLDDAAAIILALSSAATKAGISVLGITTVAGNANITQATENTYRVLKLLNQTNIPIIVGSHQPIVNNHESDYYFGPDGFGNKPDIPPSVTEMDKVTLKWQMGGIYSAFQFIISKALQHMGQVELVALGPLTNVAYAVRQEPRITLWLKSLIIMGGNMRGVGNVKPAAEFNFYSDPEAAEIVLEEFQPTVITWELCLDNPQNWTWYDSLMSHPGPKTNFMKQLEEYFVSTSKARGSPGYLFVDGLAMGIAIDPTIATSTKNISAEVELDGELTRGMMVVDWRGYGPPKYPIILVTSYDDSKMRNLYESALTEDLSTHDELLI